jgi:hypothetical protein
MWETFLQCHILKIAGDALRWSPPTAVKCTTFSDEILQSNNVKISLGM